jgi:uncharacterized membrane protein YeaQ/YmgE (transglycosylase-associated protein family)
MGFIAWIVLGLIAGFIASKIVNRHGEGILVDIILGIVGAILGGWIMTSLGGAGVNGFNIYSLAVAIIGAVVILLLGHAVRRIM